MPMAATAFGIEVPLGKNTRSLFSAPTFSAFDALLPEIWLDRFTLNSAKFARKCGIKLGVRSKPTDQLCPLPGSGCAGPPLAVMPLTELLTVQVEAPQVTPEPG